MIGGFRQWLQRLFSARRVAARAGRELDVVLSLNSAAQRDAIELAHGEQHRAREMRNTINDVLARMENR